MKNHKQIPQFQTEFCYARISARAVRQALVDRTLALFSPLKKKQAQNFCTYLENHRERIINYDYYQTEQICPKAIVLNVKSNCLFQAIASIKNSARLISSHNDKFLRS